MGYFFGLGYGSKAVLGSALKDSQLIFSMLASILTFSFNLNLGLFLAFWGPNGLFFGGLCKVKNVFLGLLIHLNNFYFLCAFNSYF